MKTKRGQIAIFVIIMIIIIVLVIGFIFLKNKSIKEASPDNINKVPLFIENCIESTAKDSLFHIGERGGYFTVPNLSTKEGIPYYFYKDKDYSLSKEDIEKEISLYMDNFIYFCLRDYSQFNDLEVTTNDFKTKTIIKKNKILFEIDYPVSIKKGEKSINFNHFEYSLDIRLGFIIDIIDSIMSEQINNPMGVCLTCLYEVAQKNDIYVHMFDSSDDGAIILVIRDPYSNLYNENYMFYFANKLDSLNRPEIINEVENEV